MLALGVSNLHDKYIIVKYLRLSLDDGDKAESDSIANQRNLIDFHIAKIFKGKAYETIELIDDGYTGTNMNRPAMKKLLILAETHGINCIIVKDFSRFARDYIEVGRYAEQKFPEWQIRFISINDKYDSQDYIGTTGGVEVALKNITYTMYSRDLSEKVRSARRIQYKQGKFVSPYAFYGYIKDSDDKTKIVVDNVAAENVKRIFNMRCAGITPSQIAIQFNKEGILTPAKYKKSIDPLCRDWNSVSDYALWTPSIIGNILRDERYTGKMISLKHERITVGSPKVKSVSKEDRIVVCNTHEPIISQELFDSVRSLSKRTAKPTPSRVSLQGLIRCGGCKHRMTSYGTKVQNIKYYCVYKKYDEHNSCFQGRVSEKELSEIVYEAVKKELEKTVKLSEMKQKFDDAVQRNCKKIEALNRKIGELKIKKKDGYIRLTKNEITEQEFQSLRDEVNRNIEQIKKECTDLQGEAILSEDVSFIELFRKYVGVKEPNREVITDLIKAIYVYPDKRIEIQWNFKEIGL